MNLTRRRVTAAAFSFLILSYFALAAAVNFDMLLTHERGSGTVNPIVLLSYVFMSRRCQTLWLLLCGVSAAGVCYALFGKQYLDYHSKMFEVVPGFEIPMPEGQGQYGTAWWLPREQYGEVFASANIADGIELPDALAERYVEERGKLDGAIENG